MRLPASKVQAHALPQLGQGDLSFPTSKKISYLREGIRFCVLFPPKEKLICSRMDLSEKLGKTSLERCTFLS